MKRSAGILFVLKAPVKKVLLVHATNSSWWRSYGPPKGTVDEGESTVEAACRETLEEIGIRIIPEQLKNLEIVDYTKGNSVFKRVYVYVLYITSLSEIGLTSESIPKSQLQLDEVDEAKFFDEEEAKMRVLPRFSKLLEKVFSQSYP